MSNLNNLMNTIPVLAGIYSRSFGVEVKFGRPRTTGDTIWIPYPTEENVASTLCYLGHESAHIKFSDMSEEGLNAIGTGLKGKLAGIIEDTYVENRFLQEYAGMREYFNNTIAKFINKPVPSDATMIVLEYIFSYIRGKLTNYQSTFETVDMLGNALDQLDTVFKHDLEQIMNKTLECKHSNDCNALADEIIAFLKQSKEESSQSPNDDESESEDSGSGQNPNDDESESEDSGSGQNPNDDESESEDSGSGQNPNDDESESEDSGSGQNPNDDEFGSKGCQLNNAIKSLLSNNDDDNVVDMDMDFGQMLKESLQGENVEDTEELELFGEGNDAYDTVTLPSSIDGSYDSIEGYHSFRKESLGVSSVLEQSLRRFLEDRVREVSRTERRTSRRLAFGKAHRILVGDTRIFEHRYTERLSIDTHLCLLADISESMGIEALNATKLSTYTLLSTLDKVSGVISSAYAFGTGYGDQLLTLKKSNERFSELVGRRISNLTAMGSTPSATAYWKSIHTIVAAPKKRNIVIMITDGTPDRVKDTKIVVKLMKENGIQVLCVGIGRHFNENTSREIYGNDYIHILDFNELAVKLVQISKAML